MKEYLSFEGLSHFFNKLLSKIESTYAKSSDLTNPISRITQNENDIADLETQVNLKVPTSRTVNGKALTQNITLSASDVGADPVGTAQTKADAALSSANSYTDTKIADLVDSAPDTLNTLNELAAAIQENDDVVEALNSAVGNKVDKVEGMGLSTNDYTDADKALVDGINDLHLIANTGSWNDLEDKPVETAKKYDSDNFPVITVTTNGQMTRDYGIMPNSGQFEVIFDGQVYDCDAILVDEQIPIGPTTIKGRRIYLGNLSLCDAGEDNGLPFCITDRAPSSVLTIYVKDPSVEHTIQATRFEMGECFIEDYIPDTIARTENLHTVAITGSWNDIENKKLIVTDDGDGNVTISL